MTSDSLSLAQLTLRMAERDDAGTIARMMHEFDLYLSAIDGSAPWIDVNAATHKLVRLGFDEQSLFKCLIAEEDGRPAGYAIYHVGFWADDLVGAVFLTDLFVREKWRGKGVGKAMMEQLGVLGRAAGCEQILWTVWRQNPAAEQFYKGLGAVPVEDELLMRLKI